MQVEKLFLLLVLREAVKVDVILSFKIQKRKDEMHKMKAMDKRARGGNKKGKKKFSFNKVEAKT